MRMWLIRSIRLLKIETINKVAKKESKLMSSS
jgi:hypothetical protein